MALAKVYTRASWGIQAPLVTVEVHLSGGLPGFTLVGLPETAVKESRERVRSAILNANLNFPQSRITINLAPAELPKSGGRFDLAMAVGILVASGQLKAKSLEQVELIGELALSGEVRPVLGLLPALLAAAKLGHSSIVPQGNQVEAGLCQSAEVYLCSHLVEVLQYLRGDASLPSPQPLHPAPATNLPDLGDVVGQDAAKRALTMAAVGGHNLLLRGPPGTGKTMLAARLPAILPPLTQEQAIEVAALRSLSGHGASSVDWYLAPFRAPHHTSSAVALVGGGSTLHPGEVSLAHHGVLFLDEVPEFSPRVLEALREPLESGAIQISRARYQVQLPARFQLLATCNNCPCGHHGDPEKQCTCSPDKLRNYQQRLSGPLLDRIDMQVWMPRLKPQERERLLHNPTRRSSDESVSLRKKVMVCRDQQYARQGKLNAHLESGELQQHCALQKPEQELLSKAMQHYQLSTRAGLRILRIARTIADWEEDEQVGKTHVLEAIHYRTGN